MSKSAQKFNKQIKTRSHTLTRLTNNNNIGKGKDLIFYLFVCYDLTQKLLDRFLKLFNYYNATLSLSNISYIYYKKNREP